MNRSKPSLLPAFLPLIVSVVAVAAFMFGLYKGRGSADVQKLRHALDRIEHRYYGESSSPELVDSAMEAMVIHLGDPYSDYYTAEAYREVHESLKGEFAGVGIRIELDAETGYLNVQTPIPGSPAFAADILPGDQITEVNGKSIKGESLRDIVMKIKGKPGSEVTLTILRKGQPAFKVTLMRAIVQVSAVISRMLDGKIGYVRISEFSKMMDDFDSHVQRLIKEGMAALIIDLRFNGGGLLEECVELADRFLSKGKIVSTRGRTDGDTHDYLANSEGTLPDLPVVVLVNEASASASEIFAGAMKDRGRGNLVGGRTYGKASVQTPFPLGDGSHLKLTTARYYTPSGTDLNRVEGGKEYGLEPDYRIEMSPTEYADLMRQWSNELVVKGEPPPGPENFVDHQLEAALEVLRARMAGRVPDVKPRIIEVEEKPVEEEPVEQE